MEHREPGWGWVFHPKLSGCVAPSLVALPQRFPLPWFFLLPVKQAVKRSPQATFLMVTPDWPSRNRQTNWGCSCSVAPGRMSPPDVPTGGGWKRQENHPEGLCVARNQCLLYGQQTSGGGEGSIRNKTHKKERAKGHP